MAPPPERHFPAAWRQRGHHIVYPGPAWNSREPGDARRSPDTAAETLLRNFAGAGVDIGLVQRVEAPTSSAICLVRPDGERALLYHLGAAAEEFRHFDFPWDATHFHLAAVYRMKHLRRIGPDLLKRAKAAGLRTSLDTQWDTEGEWMKVLAPSLPYTDYTMMNEEEARLLTGHSDPDGAAGPSGAKEQPRDR